MFLKVDGLRGEKGQKGEPAIIEPVSNTFFMTRILTNISGGDWHNNRFYWHKSFCIFLVYVSIHMFRHRTNILPQAPGAVVFLNSLLICIYIQIDHSSFTQCNSQHRSCVLHAKRNNYIHMMEIIGLFMFSLRTLHISIFTSCSRGS